MPVKVPGGRRAALLSLLCFSLGVLVATVGARHAHERRARLPAEDDLLYLPRASALSALSLGHHELAADLVYLRAVVYFGSEITGGKSFRWLESYLQTIVELDPQWRTPYRWAGVAPLYDGTPITREDVEVANRFLRLGIAHFPSDWELPFMLACNLLFELHPKDADEKARFTAEAAQWLERASLVGGAPPWVPLLAATTMRKEGREEAALHHLEQVYYATSDERTREEVKNRLLSLKAKVDFERAARERTAFERGWQAELPYVPPDLYVLIGSSPSPGLDWHKLATSRGLLPAAAP
jgi:hypothetical protein